MSAGKPAKLVGGRRIVNTVFDVLLARIAEGRSLADAVRAPRMHTQGDREVVVERAWPAAETVHFLGLSLSFGVLLAVNLRILGVMKQVAFADVHRLLPWGMLGFGANLITGMLFYIGQPKQYTDSAPFYWKVVFLMIAGANFLYLTVFTKAWANTDGDVRWDSSPTDKAMAVVSMFAWLTVLYGGRMLPFIGHSF